MGLLHGSKLDKSVCLDFLDNWDALIIEVEIIKQNLGLSIISNKNEISDDVIKIPLGMDKLSQQKIRIGQSFFRRAILSAYSNRCCITGIDIPNLLRASHIKPWKDSNDINEKTNPQNGILFNALHDTAFDKGYITISTDYKIIVSPQIYEYGEKTRFYFSSLSGQQICLPNRFLPSKTFIEYHNNVIFKNKALYKD